MTRRWTFVAVLFVGIWSWSCSDVTTEAVDLAVIPTPDLQKEPERDSSLQDTLPDSSELPDSTQTDSKLPDQGLADFKVMVISDTHLDPEYPKHKGWLEDVVKAINAGKPGVERLIVTGDLVTYIYPNSPDTSLNLLNQAIGILKKLSVPFHPVMGNHEYKLAPGSDGGATLAKGEAIWNKSTGLQPYYTVITKGWKLVMLNTMRGRANDRAFDDAEVAWLATELAGGKPTMLFLHHPLQTSALKYWCKKNLVTQKQEAAFFALLKQHKSQIKGIFVGHGHLFVKDTLYGVPVFETGSVGENPILGGPQNHHVITVHPASQSITVTKGSPIPYL
jgi:hypothetical protein